MEYASTKLPRHWFNGVNFTPTNMDNQNNEVTSVIEVKNAKKYVVLPDGRMARLLKPVKVKQYLYYSYINDEKKAVRISAKDSLNINNVEVVKSK